MLETEHTADGTLRCLRDCGCGEEIVERYRTLAGEGRTRDQIRLLERQRRQLMKNLHGVQEQIDCIDFIIRRLEERGRGMA